MKIIKKYCSQAQSMVEKVLFIDSSCGFTPCADSTIRSHSTVYNEPIFNQFNIRFTLKPKLEFSKILLQDLPQIITTEQQIYPNPWSERIMRDCIKAGYQCIKGCYDNQPDVVVCYAFLLVGYQETNLLNISVNPRFQRQSLATQMLHRLLLISRINQAKHMWLEVRASNKAAIALYEKFDFKEVGMRKNYYRYKNATGQNIKEHAILMSKRIIP